MVIRVCRAWIARHVVAITLSGCALAVVMLQVPLLRKAFELDELFTLRFAVSSWSSLWHYLRFDNTPPFFYLVAWFWVRLVPLQPVIIRILPAIFGIGAVCAAYWALRPVFGKRAALFASALFALMPAVTDINGFFRAYSMVAALSFVYLGFWFRWAQKPTRKLYIAATAFGALSVLTHIQAVTVVVAAVCGSLVSSAARRRWRPLLLHAIAVAVVFVAWLFFFSGYFRVTQGGEAWYGNLHEQWLTQVLHLAFPFTGLSAFTSQMYSALAIVATLVTFVFGVRKTVGLALRGRSVPAATLLLLSLFYILVPATLHITVTRYLLLSCFAIYAICAIGLAKMKYIFSSTALLLLFVGWMANLWPTQHVRVVENFKIFYHEKYRQGDLILVHPFGEAWPLKTVLPPSMSVEGVLPIRYQTNDPFEDMLLYNYRRVLSDKTIEDLAVLTAQARRIWYQGPQPGAGDFFRGDLIFQWFHKNGWSESVSAKSKSGYALITLFVRRQPTETRPVTPWMDALQAPLDVNGIRE